MVSQPSHDNMASMLVRAFAAEGVAYGRQKSLNLAAQLLGFKNLAHLRKEQREVAEDTSALVATAATAGASMPVAEFTPCRVNWSKLADVGEDWITHVRVNGNRRELYFKDWDGLRELQTLIDSLDDDAVRTRVASKPWVFEYTIAESHGRNAEIELSRLVGARETQLGHIVLSDGTDLEFFSELDDEFLRVSPSRERPFRG